MSNSNVVTLTVDNRGPLVNLASWILLTVMCLSTITKVSSKWLLIHALQLDDWYIILIIIVRLVYSNQALGSADRS